MVGKSAQLSRLSTSAPSPEEAYRLLSQFRSVPASYCESVLGYQPWEMQRRILNALAEPRARVAVKSCHSSGKTNLAAMAVFWRVATGGIAITTAPTWTQVKSLLWAEIHKTYARYKHLLGGEMFQTEWRMNPNCYALGLSTNEGVRFQGWHGDILIILDEAAGVRPDIWESIEGIRAGGDVVVLALGNPTTTGNPFHSAFLTEHHETGWTLFSIPAFTTPNFQSYPTIDHIIDADVKALDHLPRPYLITPKWVLEKYREWGPDSPMYKSRVLAEFPDHAEDALIVLAWILAAAARELPMPDNLDFVAGIDVAGPGEDKTVATVRYGPVVLDQHGWATPDPRNEVIAYLHDWQERFLNRGKLRVNVDSIAIGHYFALDIKQAGFAMTPINVGLPATVTGKAKANPFALGKASHYDDPGELRFGNLKAQLYWNLREIFRQGGISGIGGYKYEELHGQLASLRFFENEQGKILIESKADMRARGLKSPDYAESLMLAFATLPTLDRAYTPVLMVDATSGWGYDSDNPANLEGLLRVS